MNLRLRLVALVLCSSLPAGMAFAGDALAGSAQDLLAGDGWHALAADAVTASVTTDATAGAAPGTVRLRFDFAGHGGFAGVQRKLPLDIPADFALRVRLRAHSGDNNLELKFVDASGENVWWIRRADFHFTGEWQTLTFKRRHLEFAWGPTQDKLLRHCASVELVLSAGSGGDGDIEIAEFSLRAVPPETAPPAPVASASSFLAGSPAAMATDGNAATSWHSDPALGAEQSLTLDLGAMREFGGLTLRWAAGLRPADYEVQALDESAQWASIRRVTGGRGAVDRLYLPESEARQLRLLLHSGAPAGYALAEWQVEDLAFGASINNYFTALAHDAQRGDYPRGYSGEQSYWTVVGNSGGHESGLLGEDGAFELRYGGTSIEPWLSVDGHDYGWAQVQARHSLPEGYLPLPRVQWRAAPFTLDITALARTVRADGSVDAAGTDRHGDGAEHAVVSYEYRNRTAHSQQLSFALLARPFQVNPPTQFLNGAGGASPIHSASWDGQNLDINGAIALTPLLRPDDLAGARFDAGALPRDLLASAGGQSVTLQDDFGYGAVALRYQLRVAPHATVRFAIDVPWSGAPQAPLADHAALDSWLAGTVEQVAHYWRDTLNRTTLSGPPEMQPYADTLRSALAQVLVNRHGPAIQPGTRSYRRAWIRDGALSSAALLSLGHEDAVRDFLDWYAPYVYANGKVPCCVDRRGADPVPENDSHGELLYLAAEYYRYTGDRARLAQLWPTLQQVVAYIETLRQSERTSAHQFESTRMYYGLLPPSISHEGYSTKPMHSYWDDYWALKGYDEAVRMAGWLGDEAALARIAPQAAQFRQELYASLDASTHAFNLGYLPGAAELGDFDATSTTIALSPRGEVGRLPTALLNGTFELYWQQFTARRDGTLAFDAYTPYEIRNAGAMLRLGWPERARAALDWFMRDRRPTGWNQWAEVVGRDARAPRFVGDMPHGWVASDFIRSALDLYAYERDSDEALVLAAGVDARWLAGPGIAIERLRTPWGALSYALRRVGGRVHLHCSGLASPPPGGLVLMLAGREVRLPAIAGAWWIDPQGRVSAGP